MLVLHGPRMIFLKTKKTAGTSIELALSRFCTDDDIITPLTGEEERLREKLAGRRAQNCAIPLRRWKPRDVLRRLKGRRIVFYNHMSAERVIHHLGEETWRRYFTFCFERNPFDKVLSYVYFRHAELFARAPDTDVNALITPALLHRLGKGGRGIYTDRNGRIIVDRVYRYEDLDSAMADIARRLGATEPIRLPRAKSGLRRDKRHWSEVLSPENQRRISEFFAWEIDTFGYERPPLPTLALPAGDALPA